MIIKDESVMGSLFEPGLTLNEIETQVIKEALRYTKNNITMAAKLLGVDRTTIWRRLKKNEINQKH